MLQCERHVRFTLARQLCVYSQIVSVTCFDDQVRV